MITGFSPTAMRSRFASSRSKDGKLMKLFKQASITLSLSSRAAKPRLQYSMFENTVGEIPMKMLRAGVVALAASLTFPAMAQTVSTTSDMQILAQKIEADKKLLVAVNMQLTDAEGKGFWPIYAAYQKDLQAIDSRLSKTIATYADASNSGPVPDDMARQLIDDYLAIEQDEAKMKRSYVSRLSDVLPGAKVARYLQLETKMRAIVRYQLAANIPLVNSGVESPWASRY